MVSKTYVYLHTANHCDTTQHNMRKVRIYFNCLLVTSLAQQLDSGCDPGYDCLPQGNCDSFQSDKQHLRSLQAGSSEFIKALNQLRGLVCNKSHRKICCKTVNLPTTTKKPQKLEVTRSELRISTYSEHEIKTCLINQKFLLAESGKCEYLLDQEPCSPGEWVMMSQTSGVASCQPRPEQFSNCAVFLSPGGQLECEKTQSELFQSCSEVQDGIYLPENFQENTRPCPHQYQCQPRNDVYYSSISINSNPDVSAQTLVNHLSSLVCDVQNRLVCLPENNDDSIMTIENLLQTFQRPPTLCRKNPWTLAEN